VKQYLEENFKEHIDVRVIENSRKKSSEKDGNPYKATKADFVYSMAVEEEEEEDQDEEEEEEEQGLVVPSLDDPKQWRLLRGNVQVRFEHLWYRFKTCA